MFQGLPGMFVSSLVIFLAVMDGGGAMRVGGKIMKFCRALM
jgi:hypothetical protein